MDQYHQFLSRFFRLLQEAVKADPSLAEKVKTLLLAADTGTKA